MASITSIQNVNTLRGDAGSPGGTYIEAARAMGTALLIEAILNFIGPSDALRDAVGRPISQERVR